jgi:hypothetical protein
MSATELFPALGEAAGDLPRLIEPALPGTPEQIVPWRGDKIEEAVQRACVLCGQAVGHLPAQLRAEVEYRLRQERPSRSVTSRSERSKTLTV